MRVSVFRCLVSDLLPYILLYAQSVRLICCLSVCLSVSHTHRHSFHLFDDFHGVLGVIYKASLVR